MNTTKKLLNCMEFVENKQVVTVTSYAGKEEYRALTGSAKSSQEATF